MRSRVASQGVESESQQDGGQRWPGRTSVAAQLGPGAVQRKEAAAAVGTGPIQLPEGLGGADAVHASADAGVAGAGHAMPFGAEIQSSFGAHDISHVRAHTDERAASASASMDARAYAKGSDVAFGAEPDLHTAAHEAAHVVQQRGGVQLKGGVGAAGDGYEQHADAVADAVVGGRSAEPLLDAMVGPATMSAPGGAGATSAVQHQKVQPPAGDDKAGKGGQKCEAQNGPAPIGTLKTQVLEAAGHATTARALLPELKNAIELYIRVFNASESEQKSFGEQEKKLQQIITEKKQVNFLQVATFVVQVGTGVAAGFAGTTKAIEWVALAAGNLNDTHQALAALGGEDTTALEQLVASNQQFASAAAAVRADLGTAVTIIQNVVDKLITGELYQAGVKIHGVTGEIVRSAHCEMDYDAKEMSALLKPVRQTASELRTLVSDVNVVRALAEAAGTDAGARALEKDTPKRAGYDKLVELSRASADGLRMVFIVNESRFGLLMNEDVRAQLQGLGWNDHDFGFGAFDKSIGEHRLYRVQYLHDDDLAMVRPLLSLGLRYQMQFESRPEFWNNLPDIKN